MELCSDGHTEIAYAKYGTRGCPICQEIKELQDELVETKNELKFANDAWDDIDSKYTKLYNECSKHAPYLIV